MLNGTLGDRWGAETSPSGQAGAWANAIESIVPGASSAAVSATGPGDNYIDKLLQVATAYITTDAQRRLLNVQIERARAGMPPLDMSQYGVGVNVGLSPETLKLIGLGLGAFALVYFVSRRR